MRSSRLNDSQIVTDFVPSGPVAAVVLAASVPVLALVALAPAGQVMVGLSLGAIAGAGLAALIAWFVGARQAGSVGPWDVAGILAFVGFGTGMIAEPDSILKFFGLS